MIPDLVNNSIFLILLLLPGYVALRIFCWTLSLVFNKKLWKEMDNLEKIVYSLLITAIASFFVFKIIDLPKFISIIQTDPLGSIIPLLGVYLVLTFFILVIAWVGSQLMIILMDIGFLILPIILFPVMLVAYFILWLSSKISRNTSINENYERISREGFKIFFKKLCQDLKRHKWYRKFSYKVNFLERAKEKRASVQITLKNKETIDGKIYAVSYNSNEVVLEKKDMFICVGLEEISHMEASKIYEEYINKKKKRKI